MAIFAHFYDGARVLSLFLNQFALLEELDSYKKGMRR